MRRVDGLGATGPLAVELFRVAAGGDASSAFSRQPLRRASIKAPSWGVLLNRASEVRSVFPLFCAVHTARASALPGPANVGVPLQGSKMTSSQPKDRLAPFFLDPHPLFKMAALLRSPIARLPFQARSFSLTPCRNAIEVKRMGVVGAGQMVSELFTCERKLES